MRSIHKSLREARKILNDSNFKTKVLVYMSYRSFGDSYDKYENNYTDSMLNPKPIKAYVTDISPEALAWKQYGQKAQGAKEILCESRYKEWFESCAQIKIGTKYYTTFRDAASSRCLITDRQCNIIRVVLQQKDED